MSIFVEVSSNTGLVVATKCGSTTVRRMARKRGLPELSLKQLQLRNCNRVICVLRHPMERLISTWRMRYVKPVVAWHNGAESWGVWPAHKLQESTIWARRNHKDLINNPLRAWRRWLDSEYFHRMVYEEREPHIRGYAGIYSIAAEAIPDVQYHTNLTNLLEELRLPITHSHVGVWPWPARTIEDFVQAAGHVPHLDADFELWNAHK
jgi:hypothetical protein